MVKHFFESLKGKNYSHCIWGCKCLPHNVAIYYSICNKHIRTIWHHENWSRIRNYLSTNKNTYPLAYHNISLWYERLKRVFWGGGDKVGLIMDRMMKIRNRKFNSIGMWMWKLFETWKNLFRSNVLKITYTFVDRKDTMFLRNPKNINFI